VSDARELLTTGLERLDALYLAAIRAFAPPNPAFERDRIITELAKKRELAYVCGVLSEGENEAALIFEVIRDVLDTEPRASIEHLLDEARYYLRTSIDPLWQLDAQTPSLANAFAYLETVLARRIARIEKLALNPPLADDVEPDARELLGMTHEEGLRKRC
jgi:hypothetical protein